MIVAFFVPRRPVFSSVGTFDPRNVPACTPVGTPEHLFVPKRPVFSSVGTFDPQNVPDCTPVGTQEHLFVPRRPIIYSFTSTFILYGTPFSTSVRPEYSNPFSPKVEVTVVSQNTDI